MNLKIKQLRIQIGLLIIYGQKDISIKNIIFINLLNKVMRIAFLHQPNDPYPEIRIKYFLNKGYEVFSIVFPKKNKQKLIEGLTIIQLPNIFINKVPFIKRFVYSSFINKITRQYNIDVLYIINALNCYYLKSSSAKRNILELEGSDVILSPQKFHFLKTFYRKYWAYANAIVQDSQLSQQFSLSYLPENIKSEIIEIGVDFTIFNDTVEKKIVRDKYGLNDRPIVFNSRSLSPLYNYNVFFNSLPIVKKEFDSICYIITGSEAELDQATRNMIYKNKLMDNIIFCGRLDHKKEIKYYYRDADVTVSIPSSDSSPFSVYESMAIKTPVIVTDLPWLKDKFIPNKHLLAIPVGDTVELANAIVNILKKRVDLDLDAAYQKVNRDINMIAENNKLEELILSL